MFDKKANVLYSSASFVLGFVHLAMLWLHHSYSGALGQSSAWLEGGADDHFHPSGAFMEADDFLMPIFFPLGL